MTDSYYLSSFRPLEDPESRVRLQRPKSGVKHTLHLLTTNVTYSKNNNKVRLHVKKEEIPYKINKTIWFNKFITTHSYWPVDDFILPKIYHPLICFNFPTFTVNYLLCVYGFYFIILFSSFRRLSCKVRNQTPFREYVVKDT